jgi:hypothetical protein
MNTIGFQYGVPAGVVDLFGVGEDSVEVEE